MRSTATSRRLPLAFLATLLLQAGVGIWWVAEQSSLLRYHQQRLDVIEAQQATAIQRETAADVRLARIEERLIAQSQTLQEIKNQLLRK